MAQIITKSDRFKVGQKVKIISGSYYNNTGTVTAVKHENNVQYMQFVRMQILSVTLDNGEQITVHERRCWEAQ